MSLAHPRPISFTKDWLVPRDDSPVAVPLSKLPDAIHQFKELLDTGWVERRLEKYRSWREQHSLDEPDFLFHREPDCNPLIPYFHAYEIWASSGYTQQLTAAGAQAIRDLANIAATVFCFEDYWGRLPGGTGVKHIRRTLQSHGHCRGMLAEFNTAVHYVQAGSNWVEPRFTDPRQSGDKSDILFSWKAGQIEVHCKSKVPGAGQTLPFDVFDYWGWCFLRDARHNNRTRRVALRLSGRPSPSKARGLRHKLGQWLESGIVFDWAPIDSDIKAQCTEIAMPDRGWSRQWLARLERNTPRYRALSAWNGSDDGRYHSVALLDVVESPTPHPVRALSSSLREAKQQATGTRPAIAHIHIFDQFDLSELVRGRQSSLFVAWLYRHLSDTCGRKISAVIFSCEPKQSSATSLVGKRECPALWFPNPEALFAIPEGLIPQSTGE